MTREISEQIASMTLRRGASIREAMKAIDRGELGLALVVDDAGTFQTLVTDGDIRRALLAGAGLESELGEVPHPPPRTASAGTPPEEIAALFSEIVRVVPLLDEDGRVADLATFDSRLRLPVAEPFLGAEELRYVSECVLTGWVSSAGEFVRRFESMFGELVETDHSLAVSNGTAALHLALLALEVGPGDEVIVPTLTFIATPNAVSYCGATPVFVDSEPATWNIDPAKIEAAITPRTKAIVAVHLFGHPADLDPILEIAQRHGLPVIEDAAQAHGATYKGRPAGGLGTIGTFSFYGNKIVTTGEGGMVVTNDPTLAERVRLLRDHGMSSERRYWHPVLGFNYRLTNLQAAIGVAQLEKIDAILAAKERLGRAYAAGLGRIDGIELPPSRDWARNVHWLYSIRVHPEFGLDRDGLMDALDGEGVETRPFFLPCHRQPLYDRGESFPVAEALADTGLSLPSAVTLSPDEVERVVNAISALRRAPVGA